ncbi:MULTISPECIES: DUF2304 domain-containing protein [unclassified Actinotalea]|uniref:DUF2304 domain-containing protein n=1 Tax=unclassified Actinotalea TaxID=2638618 RepID=UPI0015F4ACF6|nr:MULTISPECIES: DUF2304 domain-containing protein [unclassified Actinotalea]
MLIKVLLLLGVGVFVALGFRAPSGARHLALRRIALVGFAVLAVLSVLFPDAWNAVAQIVGVGRGTDLLLYGTIIVFLLTLVTTYRRFRELEAQITLLSRRLAIDEAMGALSTAPARSTGEASGSTDDGRTDD